MTGGVGLFRNSFIGFVAAGGRRCRVLLCLVSVDDGLLEDCRVGVNLLEARNLLSVVGLLKPRP